VSAIGTIRAVGSRALPQPGSERFRPLRAGIRNVWEYDNHEFWFADGWLILRGPNTAGKSKALELLLPFVLDGETRSERLDPFGGRSKSMYWNMIDFDESRRNEIGYCWIEFGRVDADGQEHFVTCVVGMRSQRAGDRKVESWFAVTPLRVGADVDLAGPDGRLLTSDRLKQALDGRGRFSTNARDHRSAVDQALFGLGLDRFESLLHLLLQLRRPKLSEKLDVAKLAGVLREALPPLDRTRLELLAQGFARLDSEAAELEVLEQARAELETFLVAYRHYARIQARLRADAVRSANSRFDDVTRTERSQRQALERADAELADVERRRAELDRESSRLSGRLKGLDLTKVHHLALVEALAAEAEQVADTSRVRAEGDARLSSEAEEEHRRAAQGARAAVARRDTLLHRTETLASDGGLGEVFEAHHLQLLAEPRAARRALEAAADRRTGLLREVHAASAAERRSREEVQAAEERAEQAVQAQREAEAAAEQAEEAVTQAAASFAAAVEAWVRALPHDVATRIVLDRSLSQQALDAALAAQAEDASIRRLAQAVCRPAREAVGRERAAAVAERGRLEGEHRELAVRRDLIAAERDDAPARIPGRPEQRPDGCAPLWRCVEFDPSLGSVERAGLEAALEASGLLDALVTPEGGLLDPESLDTAIAGASAPGRTLAGWLAPDPAGPQPAEAVAAALAVVGAGPTPASEAWVDLGGRWANGALSGRWAKEQAEFVGASARAAARARRIAEIDRQMELLTAAIRRATEQEAALADLERRVGEVELAFPSPTALRDAIRDEVRARQEVARASAAAAREAEVLGRARGRLEQARATLERAEHAADCRAGAVEGMLATLAEWRTALAETVGEIERADREQQIAEAAGERAEDRRRRADLSATEAWQRREEADRRRGEAVELRRSVGADVKDILARKEELEAAVAGTLQELTALAEVRDTVRDRLKEAQTKLSATEHEREQRERERAERLQSLAVLAGTELAALALGPIDAERDLTQVTAGLSFARSAAERLAGVTTDQRTQDEASNRLHDSYGDLRARLGADFDPHLDSTDGLSLCFAKLNGAAVGAIDLAGALDEQIGRRRETLSAEERDVIERHLLAEVGSHLGDRVHAAWMHVRRMNDQLAQHGTRSGVTLHLGWEPDPDAGVGATEALHLLRSEVHLLEAQKRATLATFLADRVRSARDDADGADTVEQMAAALDYRAWHRFTVIRRTGGRDERFTSRTQGQGSGGEQAKLAHLPLFAATAGYYASGSPTCPRLLVLDEAFAGIDDDQRADLMGMLVDLELDVVLTNYNEWGCYPQVPSVAIYHLERTDGQRGVAALRFVWDGRSCREDDPFLDSLEPPPEGLFADG
jgi:uncharacterized protein (TIGR02680 family)